MSELASVASLGVRMRQARQDGGNPSGIRLINFGIATSKYPAKIVEEFENLPGARITSHVSRLLNSERTEIENEFGVAMILHGSAYLAQLDKTNIKDYYKIVAVLNEEGKDTEIWWTLAPYLFKVLREQRVDEKKAVMQILNWAKKGETIQSVGTNTARLREFHLSGTELYNNDNQTTEGFILGKPGTYSHTLANDEAVRLVQKENAL